MKGRRNKIALGFITGILSPFLLFLILYLNSDVDTDFYAYINKTISTLYFLPLMKLALLINLAPFMVAMYLNRLLFARGILMSTFIYALLFILKYFSNGL